MTLEKHLNIDNELRIEPDTQTVTLNNARVSFADGSDDYIGNLDNPRIYGVRHAFLDFTNYQKTHMNSIKNSYEQQLRPDVLQTARRLGMRLATSIVGAPTEKQELEYVKNLHAAGTFLNTNASQSKYSLESPFQRGLADTIADCGQELARAAKSAQEPIAKLLASYNEHR